MKYRTRPDITIDALQFTGSNGAEVRAWMDAMRTPEGVEPMEHWFITKGMTTGTGKQAWNYAKDGQKWADKVRGAVYDYLQGSWVAANDGDYIIRGTRGEYYPCAADVFEAKYERV